MHVKNVKFESLRYKKYFKTKKDAELYFQMFKNI